MAVSKRIDTSRKRIIDLGCKITEEQGCKGFWTTIAMYTSHFGFGKLDHEKTIKANTVKKSFTRRNEFNQYECFVVTDRPFKTEVQILRYILSNIEDEQERTVKYNGSNGIWLSIKEYAHYTDYKPSTITHKIKKNELGAFVQYREAKASYEIFLITDPEPYSYEDAKILKERISTMVMMNDLELPSYMNLKHMIKLFSENQGLYDKLGQIAKMNKETLEIFANLKPLEIKALVSLSPAFIKTLTAISVEDMAKLNYMANEFEDWFGD